MKLQFKQLLIFVICIAFSLTSSAQIEAAGAKPKINGVCGNLLKLQDDKGSFLYLNTTIRVTYYGKPLKITAFYASKEGEPKSEQGKTTITVKGKASSSRKYSEYFNLSHEWLRYSQKSNGYFSMKMKVIDSLKRTAALKCIFEGDWGFPSAKG